MESAKKLSRFDFEVDTYARRALQPMEVPDGIRNRLRNIVDEYDGSGSLDQENSRQIYFLFVDSPPPKLPAEFDTSSRIRKLSRVLTYSESELPRIIDTRLLKDALQLIQHHFSLRALLNVFDALLQAWDASNARMLQAFIKKHLTTYEGSRKSVLRLQSNIAWYCEDDSAIQLAGHLSRSQIKLSDVWSYLELPDYTHSYCYFGAVAEAFVTSNIHFRQRDMIQVVKDIVSFFIKHNNEKTSRAVLPKLIKQLGRTAPENLRRPIQDYILQEWRDPRIADANMRWHDIPDETWRIFRLWVMREDLHFFYDTVVKRSERKNFWLLYFGKISACRIVLGRNAESLFRNNLYYQKQRKSIARLNGADRNQHAFIIKMGNHTFVDFSKGDVCYVYDRVNAPYDLSASEYYIQELADKSRAEDCVSYKNKKSAGMNWREKLDSLIESEMGIGLSPKSQLGRY